MPELPEVETVRRTLAPLITGKTIRAVSTSAKRLRFPIKTAKLKKLITNKTIKRINRRAKYLLFDLESNTTDPCTTLLIHLGMSGKLGLVKTGTPKKKHDHVIISIGENEELRFNDARRFGFVDAFPTTELKSHPRLKRLGVEPLSKDLDPVQLHRQSRKLKKPIKNYLMDHTKIVGVGNIYATEALFKASIHPKKAVGKLTLKNWQNLTLAIQTTLKAAIAKGGTTLRDFENITGESGYFAIELKVYGKHKKPCPKCKAPIKKIVQCGRSSFFCSHCQKLSS